MVPSGLNVFGSSSTRGAESTLSVTYSTGWFWRPVLYVKKSRESRGTGGDRRA
jgi:hypothetical protein